MLFVCFNSKGPGYHVRVDGVMNSMKYQEILNQNLTFSTRKLKLGHQWIFQQNSDLKNMSKSTKNGYLNPLTWPLSKTRRMNWKKSALGPWMIWRDSVKRMASGASSLYSPTKYKTQGCQQLRHMFLLKIILFLIVFSLNALLSIKSYFFLVHQKV